MTVLAMAGAGALGATVRALVAGLLPHHEHRWPWGTLVVNLLGAFVLGAVTGLVLDRGWATDWRVVVGTGFCGGLTTFSTFSLEANQLVATRDGARGAAYVAVTVLGCLGAGALGLVVGGA